MDERDESRACKRAITKKVREDASGGDELAGAVASALDRRFPRLCEPSLRDGILRATDDMLRALAEDPSLNLEAWAEAVGHDPANALSRAREAPVAYGDLRRLRKTLGVEALARRLAPGAMVALSPHEVMQHVYVSQLFISDDGLRRAIRREGDAVLPCFVEVGPDGGIKFVLTDGHHRALRNVAQSESTRLCVGERPAAAKSLMSFRQYFRDFGREIKD